MQASLWQWSQVAPALQDHLDRLRRGGPPGWRPSRLILQNYWLFDYQEFHFAQGRLVLRGANGSGKSTVLAAAITLVLDGEKRRQRMDTFGGQGRSVAYYLVGDPKATPSSDFYHDERTGYVALEFEHGRTGRHKTIGLGLHTSRSRPDLAVDSWGFVIRDRRVGRDLQLHTGGPEPVPLTMRQLRELLGKDGTVVDRTSDYQELVNRELFGFESADQYRFLLNLLLQLRSPKLNKDIRPSDVAGLLTESLPPLDEDLLDQVTQVIEDIDAILESLEETRAHLQAVAELHGALDKYLNQLAQKAALEYRTAHQRQEAAHRRRQQAQEALNQQEQALRDLGSRLEQNSLAQHETTGELQALEAHEALADQKQLEEAERDLEHARGVQRQAEEAEAAAQGALAAQEEQRERQLAEWEKEVTHQQGQAEDLAQLAAEAAWPLAEDRAAAAAAALARVQLEETAPTTTGPDGLAAPAGPAHPTTPADSTPADPAAALAADMVRAAGVEREHLLQEALTRIEAVAAAQDRHREALAAVRMASEALDQADRARQEAEAELEEAREAAVSGLYEWREGCTEVRPGEADLQAAAQALYSYTESATDPREALAPLERVAAQAEGRLQEQQQALAAERAERKHQQQQVEAELRAWLARKEAEPPRRPGQAEARRLLAQRGIPAVPLYAACEVVPELPLEMVAALEENLEESGLLDALVVPPDRAQEVAAMLGPAGLGDRWLAPGDARRGAAGGTAGTGTGRGPAAAHRDPTASTAAPGRNPAAASRTLAHFLTPAPDAPVPAAAIQAALAAVAVDPNPGAPAALPPTGGWRVGPLTGTATRRPEPTVLYLGEANRRRERERQVRRLREELAAITAAIADLDRRRAELQGRIQTLQAEVRRLQQHPALRALQSAALNVEHAWRHLSRQQEAHRAADQAAGQAHAALVSARARAEEALSRVPEARNLTPAGVQNLIRATREVVRAAAALAGHMARLPRLREQYQATLAAIRREEQRLADARRAATAAARHAAELTRRRDVIRERLQRLGVRVEELLDRIGRLRQALQQLQSEEKKLVRQQGEAQGQVNQLRQTLEERKAEVARLEAATAAAARELERRLTAYPTLAGALEQFRSSPQGPLAAAEELLKYRRGRPEELPRLVEESVRESHTALSSAYARHRSLLVNFRPELEGDYLHFRDQGARLLPYQLLERLQGERQVQENVLREKENQLYEDFILKQVAGAIRERIARAEEWRDQVNQLLAARRLSNGEVLSIRWRPLPPDRVAGSHPGRVVELLRRDVEVLTDEEVRELTDHFRSRVAEVRERERSGALENSFGEALRAVLDYRRWFAFSLHAKAPDMDRVELTDTRFAARSGAEKSLAMFIPLLAAAHARYSSAHPDVPRLVGLDEAFAGVDEQNTREMFRFLVELDFSWMMTSEKLWGVADTLPGCATYELVRRGGVVTPILYLWDGEARRGGLEEALGGAGTRLDVGAARREVAATGEAESQDRQDRQDHRSHRDQQDRRRHGSGSHSQHEQGRGHQDGRTG